MADLDNPRDYKSIYNKKKVHPVFLVPFSEGKKAPDDTAIGDGNPIEIEDTLHGGFSKREVEQGSEQTRTQDIYESSPISILPDGLSIQEQSTWIIPTVRFLSDGPKPKNDDTGAKDYVSLIRNLVKSSGTYALASIASPLVSLVVAPFLTRSLSHTDYGALVVLNTTIALGAGITQLGLSSAFFRAYSYDYESNKDRLGIFSTVITLLLITSIPFTIVVIISAPRIAGFLFNDYSYSNAVKSAALVILLQNLTVPGFAWLRAENRAGFFSLVSIGNLLLSLCATFIFVGMLHSGITGSVLAIGSGYTFVVLCTLPVILVRVGLQRGLQFRFDIARNLLSFGVPLIFNFVSYWILQLSDRYLLSIFGSLAQTASYGVAYSLGGVLSVVILSPFILAWPSTMFAIAKKDNAAQQFQLVFRWFSIILLFAAFAFSLISIAVLDVLFPPAYHAAAPVIPLVTTSIMFYGVYNVFAVGVGVRRKTWLTALFMTISALANVGLNIVLIPLYGSTGAAVSTLIAYILLALISYAANQRIYPIPFEVGKFGIALLVGVALYVGSSILAQAQGIFGTCAIYIGVLGVYAGFLVFLGKLPHWKHSRKHPASIHIVK